MGAALAGAFAGLEIAATVSACCARVMPSTRRFPPPWTIEDHNDACFIAKDKNGFAVAYVYYEEEPGRRSAANLMTKDEARRMRRTSPSCRHFCNDRSLAERPR